MFFANSNIFLEQIRELVREREPRWVVLQCEAITDVDLTAADMLRRLDEELNSNGIHLAFVELGAASRTWSRLRPATLDQEHFYPSIERALTDIASDAADGPATDRPDEQS
nr:sodium-independent anion transporter [Candidatus Microthrix sp.]